jgi:hypothetical protein
MKLFQCQKCGQLLHFENTRCERCGSPLGYLPYRETVTALVGGREARGSQQMVWRALADEQNYRLCANAAYGVCNWLVPATLPDPYCAACRHNRTIPDLSLPDNLSNWYAVEVAKHRLFYTLLQLRLPLATKAQSPDGLAFEFLSDTVSAPDREAVMTGHAHGVITINLAEADDAERERRRRQMGEPYRTLLGHFRHETTRTGRPPTGRNASFQPTPARTRGRTSPKAGRTIFTYSTRWKPRTTSAWPNIAHSCGKQ